MIYPESITTNLPQLLSSRCNLESKNMLVIERQHFLPPAAPAISYLAVIVIITIIIGFIKVMKDLKLIWLCIFF